MQLWNVAFEPLSSISTFLFDSSPFDELLQIRNMTDQSQQSSSSSTLPPASSIPVLTAEQLSPLLALLTLLPTSISTQLSSQSAQAISDLPPDARPNSYDGLIDVARFCLEEEPGQEHWNLDLRQQILRTVSQEIQSQTLSGKLERLGKDGNETETRREYQK